MFPIQFFRFLVNSLLEIFIAMKKKWFGVSFIIVLTINALMAQDTTGTWLNSFGEEAKGATAPFYRLVWKEDSEWKFREHFRSGPVHKTGQYVDFIDSVKTGTFSTFNTDSIKVAEMSFEGNIPVGPFMKWYDDGTVDTKGEYALMKTEKQAPSDDYWNPDQAIEILPSENEGIKTGVWEYYHPNGQLSAREEYTEEGNLINTEFWNADGSPGAYGAATESAPQFPGGNEGLMKFLRENVEYPVEDRNQGRSGEVLVSFIVGRDGKPKEPRIERAESRTMNEECLRLVSIMPQWMPARAYNRNEEVRYFLPIRFTNLTKRGHKEMMKKIKEAE